MVLTVQLPQLYPKQEAFAFSDKRYSLCLASTKSGKTVSALTWLLSIALGVEKNRDYLWLAPYHSQAKMAFRKTKQMVGESNRFTYNETELRIDLPNKNHLFFRSAENEQAIYGNEYWAVVVDEASRVTEKAWHATRSTMTFTGAPVRMIGNVRTKGDWFYKLCEEAKSGKQEDTSFHTISCWDAVEAGILDKKEIEDAKRILPEHIFKSLYENIVSEEGDNPFGQKFIDACLVKEYSTKEPKVFGVDIASVQDFTVEIGLDDFGIVCFYDRYQKEWPVTKQKILMDTRDVPTLIDSTGVGSPILADLKLEKQTIDGYIFSGPSRQQLLDGLAIGIQSGRIKFPNGRIYEELSSASVEYTATGGIKYVFLIDHDDAAMALALAWKHYNNYSLHLELIDNKELKDNKEIVDRWKTIIPPSINKMRRQELFNRQQIWRS